MTKKSKVEAAVNTAQPATQITRPPELMPIIYADKIFNVGFGAGVSRLGLAMETGVGAYSPIATLVLPTPVLLEAMTIVLNAIKDNPEVREGIFMGLDAIKEQINALK